MNTLVENLGLGLDVVFTTSNLLLAFAGALIGTLIGVLPGLGPVATIAILLPVTYGMSPTGALILLSGVFCGAQYGGSTTAILLNIPGETSSIVTTLDGHPMARQGRAGVAIATAALASFFAGMVATVVIVLFAPVLAEFALEFGSAEYFCLTFLGLVGAVVLASGSLLYAATMVLMGLLFSQIGLDVNSGAARFTFGMPDLYEGLEIVALAMGLFAIADVIENLARGEATSAKVQPIRKLYPSWKEVKQAAPATVRGTVIGSVLGILPGTGAVLSSFAAYAFEKRIARQPERFGAGAIEGVAGPEAANNAGAQTSFIPMLTLGIPPNATMALMIAALLIHGIAPGPQILVQQPSLFWGVIASMWVANVMLLIINLPLVGIWVSMLRIPYRLLYPAILVLCAIGVHTLNNSSFDLVVLTVAGVVGWLLARLGFQPAPFIVGFILGEPMEENFRRTLYLSDGDWRAFVDSGLSIFLLLTAALLLVLVMMPALRTIRKTTEPE